MEYPHSPKGAFTPNNQQLNGHGYDAMPHAESLNGAESLRLESADPDGINVTTSDRTPGYRSEPKRPGYRQDSPPEVIDLLYRAQAGDTEAFADLYRLSVERVTRYVAARMRERDSDAIPDLVQDAFCEALADLQSAHHDVTGWLLGHAAKACIRYDWSNRRYVRAAKTVEHEVREAQRNGSPSTTIETQAGKQTSIVRLTLVHTLARLATDQRRAMQLRFIDGLSRQQRAEAMNRSLDAVTSLEGRALRNLRASLGSTAMDGAGATASR